MTASSIVDLLRAEVEVPAISIVDVGANPLTGQKGPYQPLVDRGAAELIGFEPDPDAFIKLQEMRGAGERYYPVAIGDGGRHTLRICAMSGMNSLLQPNFALLNLLHFHGRWAEVARTVELDTVRLDDVAEVTAMDYLKIDIQGGELMVFEHAQARLRDCLVVHTEAMFVPMYEGQPLFSEQELSLRRHGLQVHRFVETVGHVLRPFAVRGDRHAPLSQLFWADVVFIKDITRPDLLASDQLLKLAVILHEIYGSVDVAHLFLHAYDQRHATGLSRIYLDWLGQLQAPATPGG